MNEKNQVIKITVSISGTSSSEKKVKENTLIEVTDTLLLKEKELGRNNVIVE